MTDYIMPVKDSSSDSCVINKAIDMALETDKRNVLICGDKWNIDAPLYIHENIHLHIDGAELCFCGKSDEYAIINSVNLKPRYSTKYGRQTGITITGENGAKISGENGIYLFNTGNFYIEGINFKCKHKCITLVHSRGGRLLNLEFADYEIGIEVREGTRDCFFDTIKGCGDKTVYFDEQKHEKTVNYNSPHIKNHIIRNIVDGDIEFSENTPVDTVIY